MSNVRSVDTDERGEDAVEEGARWVRARCL